MSTDALVWVCIPQRIDVGDGGATLHLAIAVQPRLESATLGEAGLAAWPPAALAGGAVQVDLGPTRDATQPLPGVTRVDADPALWPSLFPPDTPVASAAEGAADPRELRVAPTASDARAARQVFEAAVAVPVPAEDAAAAGDAFHAAVGAALTASPLNRANRGAAERARALANRARVNRARAVDARPPIPPDFHRTVALLREHPVVLRALGLVFDVQVAVPDARALADAGVGVIRVRWPDLPSGLPALVSPWTAYELDLGTGKFLPQSRGTVSAGMLAISDARDADETPEWSVTTLDVDLAVDRIGQAADAAGRGGDGARPVLPALRTGGIALLHAARARDMVARRARRGGQRAADPAAMVLYADDLVLGYRVDVRRGDGPWRPLCARVATYRREDGAAVGPAGVAEEGNVKAHAAVDDGDGEALHTDEVVARWQGWSLAVCQPRFDAADGGSPGAPRGAARVPGAATGLRWSFDAPPRSLPRLRYAWKYQLRARVADLAGGGLTADDPLADRCASAPTFYERYEPVVAPAVTLPDGLTPAALGPGEAADVIVVRSDRGVSPDRFAADHPEFPVQLRRTVEPARVPLAIVEQHGTLDRIPDADASWKVVRDAVAPADPRRPVPLPDPAAGGVAAFLARGFGTARQFLTSGWPPWPAATAKRVRLEPGALDALPAMRWRAGGDADELVVTLAPGHAVTVELSSTMQGDTPDHFAARHFLTPEAKLAAANGRHPLLTPAQAVRLVHAVRKPLLDPAGALTPVRRPGDTFATLSPEPATLGVDAPSTARVDVTASWREFADDAQTAVADVPVGGAALAPEGAAFDDPIRHEFGDTRHRLVTYAATAVSRHRHYFDPTGEQDDALFTARPPAFAPVHVPSSAPPAAPVVVAVTPAFRWTDETDATPPTGPDGRYTMLQRRRESLLSVVLDRPWFSSGEGEQLAVILAARAPVAPEQQAVVTEVGRDPLWTTDVPVRWPGAADLARAAGAPVPTRVSAPAADVVAVPYDVWFDGGRWHADVGFALTRPSYCPLVRLALARYQAYSVEGAAISAIVQAPFAPLLPERLLTVDRAGSTLYVRLEGLAPGGPARNRVAAVLETCPTPAAGSTDLSAGVGDADALPVWRPLAPAPAPGRESGEQDFGQELVLSIPPLAGALRLVVRETEAIVSGDAGQVPAPPELGRRTVFLDVVPIETA